jgi:hypothetical protein
MVRQKGRSRARKEGSQRWTQAAATLSGGYLIATAALAMAGLDRLRRAEGRTERLSREIRRFLPAG